MRILNLMPYSPVPAIAGGPLRIYHLLRFMARRHRVSVLFFGSPQEARETGDSYAGALQEVHAVPLPRWRS